MHGLLADVNLQGHLPYVRQLLEWLDLWPVLAELQIELATFRTLQLDPGANDRWLWNHCQQEGWVLFTDNRNDDGTDSLQSTLMDSWQPGHFPVLTLASKDRFEHSQSYAQRVATEVAELLFGIKHGEFRDQPRIFVPR